MFASVRLIRGPDFHSPNPLHQLGEQGPKRHDYGRGMCEAIDWFVREVEHGLEGVVGSCLFLKVK